MRASNASAAAGAKDAVSIPSTGGDVVAGAAESES
jgi:hypothetical protein